MSSASAPAPAPGPVKRSSAYHGRGTEAQQSKQRRQDLKRVRESVRTAHHVLLTVAADPTTIAVGAPLADLTGPLKKICSDHLVQWFGHLLRPRIHRHGDNDTDSSSDGGGAADDDVFVGLGGVGDARDGDADSDDDDVGQIFVAVDPQHLTRGFIAKLHSSPCAVGGNPHVLVNCRESKKTMPSRFAAGGRFQAQTRLNITDGEQTMLAVVATQAMSQGDCYDVGTIIEVKRYECVPIRPDGPESSAQLAMLIHEAGLIGTALCMIPHPPVAVIATGYWMSSAEDAGAVASLVGADGASRARLSAFRVVLVHVFGRRATPVRHRRHRPQQSLRCAAAPRCCA